MAMKQAISFVLGVILVITVVQIGNKSLVYAFTAFVGLTIVISTFIVWIVQSCQRDFECLINDE
jgi:hypothetical protein